MNSFKKKLFGVAFTAAVLGGITAFVFWDRSNAPSDDIILYGNINIREATLGFNVVGRINAMLVDEGDIVERGQHLASLETGVYQAEVNAAKAQLEAREAALDLLLAGSRPETIAAAKADAQVIAVDLENAKTTLARIEKLASDSFATQQQRDDARARVNSLQARMNSAEQHVLLAVQGPRIEDIAQARALVRAAEAGLALAQQHLDYTKLLAKDSGIVKTRVVEPGSVVLSYTPVYTIALTDPVWVRTYVSEPNLGKIHPGMKVEVLTDSDPNKIHEGQVGFISPVAEFTPKTVETPQVRTSLVYRLRIYVTNPDNSLRQGMPVTVRLKIEPDQPEIGGAASQ